MYCEMRLIFPSLYKMRNNICLQLSTFFPLKRYTWLISLLTIFVILFLMYITRDPTSNPLHCYHYKTLSLPSVLDYKPSKGKSIFFHETSCNSHALGKIVINSRQACAVESAARLHPNLEIYLLYLSPGIIKNEGTESDDFLQVLKSYSNVNILHVDFEQYLRDTPVENLYKEHKVEASMYPLSHASDILRYVSLWRYGGTYLDQDVIVTKPLNLPPNYAGSESDTLVAAGVLNFSPTGAGHIFARMCLKDLRDNFDGQSWPNNGPGVITRLVNKICASEDVGDNVDHPCLGNFHLYPVESFYPISWQNWTMYFNESQVKEVEDLIRNTYVVHMWNKMSSESKISVKSKVAYAKLARKYCPKVFKKCRSFF